MRSQSLFWLGALLFFASNASVLRTVDGDSLSVECSSDFQKLMGCLNYASGKANTPTKDCCGAVQTIKNSEPKCLCYIIQQAHNGSAQIKSLGIQEAKMLQLPTVCQLQNASLSFCPMILVSAAAASAQVFVPILTLYRVCRWTALLGLSPGSSDAAIFTNVSTSATPAASTGSGTSQPDKAGDSGRIKQRPALAGFHPILFAAVVILSSTLISAMVVVKAIIYDLRVLISGF
ncbi:hypothetical protein DKX38_000398 [Salix brachista]|uniref:Bifunctional inhibitor/plant lipid transfer protein/seed storage helical domain-containing protein n=1 Tax=Salix brachista TaxID=2182728 RepID=A0A5N5P0J4_9ROSI|nr:hypothetical protein DKX38_000398 [Salix brachista]